MRIVLDASVLIEALDTNSPQADRASELREWLSHEELVAPALIVWEVGNYMGRVAIEAPRQDAAQAGEAVKRITEDVALEVPDGEAVVRIVVMVARHSLTFYDASYLELTMRDPEAVLISLDRPLREAATKELGKERVFDLERAHHRFRR